MLFLLVGKIIFSHILTCVVRDRILSNAPSGILGINIGPNIVTEIMSDYFLKCAEIFFPLGDYITVNISSPNTPGLRDFHKEEVLENPRILANAKNNVRI